MFEFTRRNALKSISCGFGYMAFAGLAHAAAENEQRSSNPLLPKTHFEPKAKRVIFLCMRGGPSHVDTFDYKPALKKHEGEAPGGDAKGQNSQKGRTLLPSPWDFKPRGDSGLMISDLYPHLAEHADDLCVINGAWTDIPNHPQALVQLHTGNFQFVRPSMGAWALYGLGTENQDLPGFITIKPPARLGGAQNYGSAFLPAVYQGTRIGDQGDSLSSVKIGNISNAELPEVTQRKQIDFVQSLNRNLADRQPMNSQIDGVIESYELAFRMQSAVPQVMDTSSETQKSQKKYGIGNPLTDDFGRACLMARRFAESGVRFIELTHEGWESAIKADVQLRRNRSADRGADL
jgi:hypothetical protein